MRVGSVAMLAARFAVGRLAALFAVRRSVLAGSQRAVLVVAGLGSAPGLLATTACSSSSDRAPLPVPPRNSTAPRACPAARDVLLAIAERDDKAYGKKRARARWQVPLHFRHDAELGDAVDPASSEKLVAIDEAAARAAGTPPAPSPLWMLVEGEPACRARVDGYYAKEGVVGGVTYGVWLAGCAGPEAFVTDALAVAAPDARGCDFVRPASRVARRNGEVIDEHWQRPTRETPLPPAFARIVPAASCSPPACETLWTLDEVAAHGRPVAWRGAVTRLQVGAPGTYEEECSWDRETFGGLFVIASDGAPRAIELIDDTDLEPQTVGIVGALVDDRGARVLVTDHPGFYTTYDLGPSGAAVDRELRWYAPHPEGMAYSFVDLGPICHPL